MLSVPPVRLGRVAPRWGIPRWRLASILLVASFAGAAVLELGVWPQKNQPVIFAVPLLFAAVFLPPVAARLAVGVSVVLDLADAFLARSPLDIWPFTLLALAVTGVLAVWLAEERQRTARLARESDAARRRQEKFLSMVTHDLGSPTFAIVGMSQLLLGRHANDLSPDDRKALGVIESAGRRLQRHIGDLRDAMLIDLEHFAIQPAQVDLVLAARQVIERQQAAAPGHQLQLVGVDKLVGQWDPERLDQLLDNLVANAIKYSAGGEICVTIAEQAGEAQLSVADHGAGIAPEKVASLFQPFVRAERTSSKKGLGLGLYIAKGIVEAHGGRIWLDSLPQRGTTVFVALPL
jgi:signal transduction histidine kinase